MAFQYEVNGQIVEFEKEPSEQDIDEAASMLGGSKQATQESMQTQGGVGVGGPSLTLSPIEEFRDISRNRSPINTLERVAFAFGDDGGREKFLRDRFNIVERTPDGKFIAGNDEASLAPIDPEGMFNDVLGDVADLSNYIAPIAGQIMGASAGSAMGPAGTVVGGGLGAGAGEAVNKVIGKSLGVSEQTASEQATDIVISSVFGSLGEGIGMGLKAAAPVMAKNFFGMIKNLQKQSPHMAEAMNNVTAKTLRFLSNVDEGATKTVLKYGPDEVFNPVNENPQSIIQISKSVIDDIQTHRNDLGVKLGKSIQNIGPNISKPILNIGKEVSTLLDDMVDKGVLKPDLTLNKNFISESGTDVAVMKQILGQLGVKPSKSGASIQFKNLISPKEAINFKRQLSSRFESLSPDTARILRNFRTGISSHLDDFANKTGNQDFISANKAFSDFAQAMDTLQGDGFNFDKQISVANFINGYFKKNPVAIKALEVVDKQTPLPIMENIEKFAAAQLFKNANPNFLRFGMIAPLLGFQSSSGIQDKTGWIATGLLLGTPAGNKVLMKAGFNMAKGMPFGKAMPKSLMSKIGGETAQKATVAALSQLTAGKEKQGRRSREQ